MDFCKFDVKNHHFGENQRVQRIKICELYRIHAFLCFSQTCVAQNRVEKAFVAGLFWCSLPRAVN